MARFNNLLVATTAMVALTAAANATVLSTNQTTTQLTSETVGGLSVTGATVVSVTGHAAIEISASTATAVSSTLNTSASAILRSNQVSGTVAILPGSTGAAVINNSGTIINYGLNGYAISGTSAVDAITIRNTGTISGSIATGGGNDNLLFSGGTVTGNIQTNGGTDYVSVTGANTRINGTIDLGGGNDSIDLVGGARVSASTPGGIAIDGGAGTNTLRFLNGTFSTLGSIDNIQNLRVSNSTLNLNHGTTGKVASFVVDRGATVNSNADQELTASGVLNVSGTLNIAAGKVISASTVSFANGGNLGIHINTSSSYGRIERLATAGTFTGGSLTIHLGNAYIASGTQFRIVSATGGTGITATPSLTTVNHGLYTYHISTTGANEGLSLTVYRKSTSSAAANSTNVGIANTLDGVSTTTNTKLTAIHGLINAQGSTAGVNTVLEKLAPAVDTGAALAAVDTATQTGTQVSNRLASLRGNSVNTGDGMFSNHFWMQGFGNVTEQDDKKGRRGYDASTYGASFGLDTNTIVQGATTGLAFSYGKTNVDSNAASNAETDVDNYLVSLYGSRVYDGGVFINGLASVGFGKYETSRDTGIGRANGEFDGLQYSAKLEAGKDFTYDWWTLTPAASAQYTYVDFDSYTETGPGATLRVDSKSFNAIDLGLGGQVAYNIPMESGGTFSPRVRAKYIYRAGDDSMETNSRFVAGGAAFNTQGIEADRSSLNLGAGLLLSSVGGLDVSVDYDADIRDSLTGHTGQLKLRWAF